MRSLPSIHLDLLAATLKLPVDLVTTALQLLDDGNTPSFIARYRRDAVGGIDENAIRELQRLAAKFRALEERKHKIRKSLVSRGKLTADLAAGIEAAQSAKDLEDLYLPFKGHKRTLATVARQRGLSSLADDLLEGTLAGADLASRLEHQVSAVAELATPAEALAGAGHILAEQFSERVDVRARLRQVFRETGRVTCSRAETAPGSPPDKDQQKRSKSYRDYCDFSEPLRCIPPHRILAVNRGERSKVLRVRITCDADVMVAAMESLLIPAGHPHAELLVRCAQDAWQRLIQPSLEREFRRELSERAEQHAIQVFACNLRNLLLQAPVRGHRLVAIAAGFRSGCKLAALDEFGNVLAHRVIHVIGDPQRRDEGRRTLVRLIREQGASVVAIGNGNACRQAEQLVADVIAHELADLDLAYTIVNEAGASVYSTSMVGVEELPQYDAEMRSAISIGRRLLDPLSELVKINPANIGVGLYQHDVKARNLQESLDAVVAACVNFVSVDVNTASPALLKYVSGLNQLSARSLYEYRCQQGPFRSRAEFRNVPGFGDVAYTQAAGFLKIYDGENPLDATIIHPESYELANRVLARLRGCKGERSQANAAADARTEANRRLSGSDTDRDVDVVGLATELGVGELLLSDILTALTRPQRDPRDGLPSPVFRRSILKLDDLKPGMELQGTVLNVVDFGAFVDIGISDSALVHISQLVDRFVNDPHEIVGVGDVLRVWVLDVDLARRRVSVTAIPPDRRRRDKSAARRSDEERAASRKQHGRPPRPHLASRSTQTAPVSGPAAPLSEAMASGKEPLRSFADLKQYLETQPPADDDPGNGAGD